MNQINQIETEQAIISNYLVQIKGALEHNRGRLIEEYASFLNATYRRLQIAGDLTYAENLAKAIYEKDKLKAKAPIVQNGGVE